MKIGYPCKNLSVDCIGDRTFRLKSYSEERLVSTVRNNLQCLLDMLRFNAAHHIMFFRITSDLIPFASHPVCTVDWRTSFSSMFNETGGFIRTHNMRISMHPGQFVVINSRWEDVFQRSRAELMYHLQVLEALGLDRTAKIQIHVGGVYGDRSESMGRFGKRLGMLDKSIRQRLVIENDDRNYTLRDCLDISNLTGLPVLFDVFHHRVNTSGETVRHAMKRVSATWGEEDGLPMVDYGSQARARKPGTHSDSIDLDDFKAFIEETRPFDFDVMLEIKDKEISAARAIESVRRDPRFQV